jgi:hypothetical protein
VSNEIASGAAGKNASKSKISKKTQEPRPETLRRIVNASVPGRYRFRLAARKSRKNPTSASHSGKSAALCLGAINLSRNTKKREVA